MIAAGSKTTWLLACTTAALALLVGCGGGDSTTSASKEKTVDWSIYPPGPTRQFIVPGGDNAVQTFGWEGTPAERKQVSETIAAWMRARAVQDWAKDCSYFSSGYTKNITTDAHGVTNGRVKSCPEALAYFKHEASGDYVNNFKGTSVASLRVGEGHGYAQYHGNDGKDWIVPVEKNDGEWKVAIATPIDRLK
jgi:hypothetical protein